MGAGCCIRRCLVARAALSLQRGRLDLACAGRNVCLVSALGTSERGRDGRDADRCRGDGYHWHENRALSDDGSRVFFSTAQALVPEDVNGRVDVYEYESGGVHLISSGRSPADSWFMDASASGNDVFFTTSQQLVGWDTDQEYDVYDARVGGGLPDPVPSATPCADGGCQGALATQPLVPPAASDVFNGAGDAGGKLKPRVKPCRRGFVRKRVRGRVRCVKRPKRQVKARRARARVRRDGQRRKA